MMKTALAKTNKQDKRKKLITPQEAEKILKRLKVKLPSTFCDEVKKARYSNITAGDLDEILRIARFWEPSLLESPENPGKQFGIFVSIMTVSMFRIGCVVVNSNPRSSTYIGKFVEINPEVELLKDEGVFSRLSHGLKASLPYTRTCNKYDDISLINEIM